MNPTVLNVALGQRSYPIWIGCGLLDQSDWLESYVPGRRVAVVSNETVAPLYLARLTAVLEGAGKTVIPIVLPDGEQFKNWETLNQIFDGLLGHNCERSTPILALGGGVVGDMTGFAAACYQRGAPFIQVPTTLLAQVDSSVGGKTAINHPLGKNMIGAFHQPKLVLADLDTLDTLPDQELRAGLAEVIKYGLIRDLPFLAWLEAHMAGLLARDKTLLAAAVRRSCENKAEVVARDEREGGERALLNLGHTFGHAIEAGMGYGVWLHGEAVAAGTMMAVDLSRQLGWLSDADVTRVEALLTRAGLPVRGPAAMTADQYLPLMLHDKKVQDGRLRLVLLQGLGRGVVSDQATSEQILAAIRARSDH